MLAAVLFLLSLERGLFRASAFMAGRLAAYAGWGAVLFVFTDRVFDLVTDSPSTLVLLIKAILGMLLVAMAMKIAMGGEDPDALPSKIMDVFSGISALQLIGLGMLVSLFQVRHILLMFVGMTEIAVAGLTIMGSLIAATILILMINASQLILIGVYMAAADRADALIRSAEIWLIQNNRRVAAVIGLVGVFLLWDGVNGLGVIG
jgi:hypothetical protein